MIVKPGRQFQAGFLRLGLRNRESGGGLELLARPATLVISTSPEDEGILIVIQITKSR